MRRPVVYNKPALNDVAQAGAARARPVKQDLSPAVRLITVAVAFAEPF